MGRREVRRGDGGAPREVILDDFNLLGFWNSTERIYQEGDHAFRKCTHRLFWFLPL